MSSSAIRLPPDREVEDGERPLAGEYDEARRQPERVVENEGKPLGRRELFKNDEHGQPDRIPR
jgi:hypothetical protein